MSRKRTSVCRERAGVWMVERSVHRGGNGVSMTRVGVSRGVWIGTGDVIDDIDDVVC